METSAVALPSTPAAVMGGQADAIKQWHEQIDRIIYLASLASKFNDVDPMMDDLRRITATWDGSSLLDPSQEQKLDDLEARLKQYLITADPLRMFTAESLEKQLAERGQTAKTNSVLRSVIIILLASVVAPALSYLPFIPLSSENRYFLAVPLFFVVLHIGISWLYLTTLKNFHEEVRKAFKLFAVGVVLFGVAFSHYAAIGAFDLHRYAVFQYAGVTWLVAAPYFFIYFGMRTYAKQLGIQSWALKLPIVLGAWLVVLLLISLTPPEDSSQSQLIAIYQNTGGICLPYFALVSAILVRKIRKTVTLTYARPMMWMYAYLVLNVVTATLANIPILTSAGGGISLLTMMVLFGVPDQLLLLATGYSFKKELSK